LMNKAYSFFTFIKENNIPVIEDGLYKYINKGVASFFNLFLNEYLPSLIGTTSVINSYNNDKKYKKNRKPIQIIPLEWVESQKILKIEDNTQIIIEDWRKAYPHSTSYVRGKGEDIFNILEKWEVGIINEYHGFEVGGEHLVRDIERGEEIVVRRNLPKKTLIVKLSSLKEIEQIKEYIEIREKNQIKFQFNIVLSFSSDILFEGNEFGGFDLPLYSINSVQI
jgi:hypothetical protein